MNGSLEKKILQGNDRLRKNLEAEYENVRTLGTYMCRENQFSMDEVIDMFFTYEPRIPILEDNGANYSLAIICQGWISGGKTVRFEAFDALLAYDSSADILLRVGARNYKA